MWINYNTQLSAEGAVLQYMQDGGSAWKDVGGINTGINWYNNNTIASRPGNQQSGWSGNSNGWIQSRQELDSLSNKTNIRFRIVYATLAGATATDGFAFDDIRIGENNKKVLFEYFTNLSDPISNRSNQSMDSVLQITSSDAVGIQYHTSFPGPDSINAQNMAYPSGRLLYYGIGKVPTAFMDGGPLVNYRYDFTTRSPNLSDINKRIVADPLFDLKITSAISDHTISGIINIAALNGINYTEVTLYIAIVEDIKIQSNASISSLNNVLKYLYPSASGTSIKNSWVKGQNINVNYTWQINNVNNPSYLKVVTFVQNDITREVYQANVFKAGTVTSSNPGMNQSSPNFKITSYPNPTGDHVTISYGMELGKGYEMQIISRDGKIMTDTPLRQGTSELELSLNNIADGLYFIRVFNKIGETHMAKLMIIK